MKYLNSSFLLILLTSAHALSAADPATWNLWPDTPPGEVVTLPPESDRTTDDSRLAAGKRVTRLQNVSVPTLTIYKPDSKIDTGASVIIAPGGGFTILAFDLEGGLEPTTLCLFPVASRTLPCAQFGLGVVVRLGSETPKKQVTP